MDVPWSSRLYRVATLALPGLLHEFSSPLAIIRNDAQFLTQETKGTTLSRGEDLADVAKELESASERLLLLLAALKTAPLTAEVGRPFGPVCNSVLTLLHNHWKYAWKVQPLVNDTVILPCAEGWAWVAWAEALQTLTSGLATGGTLTFETGQLEFGVWAHVVPAGPQDPKGWAAFVGKWKALVSQGPLTGEWEPSPEGGWRTILWFRKVL